MIHRSDSGRGHKLLDRIVVAHFADLGARPVPRESAADHRTRAHRSGRVPRERRKTRSEHGNDGGQQRRSLSLADRPVTFPCSCAP